MKWPPSSSLVSEAFSDLLDAADIKSDQDQRNRHNGADGYDPWKHIIASELSIWTACVMSLWIHPVEFGYRQREDCRHECKGQLRFVRFALT
jgi:hypothetical protein